MSNEKPLHVRVAEALGWKAWQSKHGYWNITEPDGTEHDGFGMRPAPKFDSETGKPLPPRPWWDEYDPPRYDTDWSAAGPLIDKLGLTVGQDHDETLDPALPERWFAVLAFQFDEHYWYCEPQPNAYGATALEAVCHLILALKEAGKLEAA